MADVDTNKKLSDKISEKQDIVNQLREGEKRGNLINNKSQSSGGMEDAKQGFYESDDDFFNSIRSNDNSQLKTFDVQEEEMLYHSVVELFPDGIFVLDLKGIIQSCNATAVTLLGYSKEELIGHKFSEMSKFDEKGIATYLNNFDSIIQGNIINPFDLKIQKKDGTLFTAEIRTRLLTQNGKKFGIQVITRKISDIKIQDRKIKESKDSLQRILSHIPDMISVHDPEMNIIYSNWKGFANIPEDKRILKTKCYKTYRGLDHICPDCKAGIVLNTKESIQVELELPEGVWVDLRVLPLVDDNNDVELFVEWVRDISKRKETEKSLLESESRFRDLVDNTPDFIYSLNRERRHTAVNHSICTALGLEEHEIIGKNHLELGFPKDICEGWHKLHDKVFSTKQVVKAETSTPMPDGTNHIYEVVLTPIFDENENVAGIRGISRDITERKKSEDSLKESEERFRKLSNLTFEGILIHNNGVVIDVNDSFVNMFGYTRAELIGKNVIRLLVPEKYHSIIKDNIVRNYAKPYEIVTHKKDGTLVPVEIEAKDIKNNDQEFRVAAIRDISERKKAEFQLKDSNRRLKEAEEIGRIGHVDWDVRQGKAIWSDMTFELYERDPSLGPPSYEEIMNLHVSEDARRLKEAVEHAMQTGEPYNLDLKVQLPSGRIAYHHIIGKPIKDEQGNIISIRGTVQDVTERKKSMDELQRSEENYRTIFNNATDTIFIHDCTNGKIIDVNQTTIDTFGYTKEEFFEMDVGDFSINEPPYTQEEAFEWMQKGVNEGPQLFEWLAKSKAGDLIWFENSLQLVQISGEKRVVVMGRNITDQKQTEEALKESERKYRTYVDTAPIGIFIVNKSGKYIETNEAASKITGYNKEELLSMNIADTLPEEGKKDGLNHFQTVVENGFSQGEAMYLHKNGSTRWWSVVAVKLSENRFLGFTQDITDKKLAEKEILQSKKETEMILNTAADGIRIVNKGFNVISLNDTFCEMIDVSKDEALGKKCYDLFKSEHCGTENCALNRVLRTGRKFETEGVRIRSDGKKIPCMIRATPFKDENNTIHGVIEDYRDITTIIEKEKQLQRTHEELQKLNKELEEKVEERTEKIKQLLKQKDEFINQLGHDLKNPLGPFVQLLPVLKNHVFNEKDKEMVEVLMRNTHYMRNLVKKTIDLAKLNSSKTRFSFEKVSLSDLVDEVASVNSSLFENHEVVVENNVSSDCLVHIDPFHIQEVFTNLFNNAVKYSEDKRWIGVDAVMKDDCVLVSVRDKGVGISDEQLPFLFDEYYKADSSRHDFDSSGLGLPICKRIVEKHGGRIWAESKGLGKGSTFYFTLPFIKYKN